MTDPDQAAFWQWFRAYVAAIAARAQGGKGFGFIHPAEPRQRAAAAFKLSGIVAIWQWEKANAARVRREINQAAKPYGFRVSKGRGGYARLERIPARTVRH